MELYIFFEIEESGSTTTDGTDITNRNNMIQLH